MKLLVLRPSAAPFALAERQCAILRAVQVAEAVAPGDVVNPTLYPNANGRDLQLQPGSIYRAYTGVALPGLHLRELQVEASASAFAGSGLRVERLSFGDNGELLVFFSLLKPLRFDRDMPLFELRSLALGQESAPETTWAPTSLPDRSSALPATAGETRTIKTVDAPVPAAAPKAPVDANAWLNSPDRAVGRVVETPAAQPAAPTAVTLAL
jgi:hypothetical protein